MTVHTCADVPNVYVKDIIFLIILDTCRNRLNGSQIANQTDYNYSGALDPKTRPFVSVLCTATLRTKEAWENPEVSGYLSAFTHYVTSEECGLFEPNVPIQMALELACQNEPTPEIIEAGSYPHGT